MQRQDIEALFERYRNGKATAYDIQVMESWYLSRAGKFDARYLIADRLEDAESLRSELQLERPAGKEVSLWQRLAVAVLVLVVFGAGLFAYLGIGESQSEEMAGISPGRNAATLVLDDGSRFSLSDTPVGQIARADGAVIEKTSSGDLIYQHTAKPRQTTKYHTLLTANGEQYKIQLPDGSKVWLNAGSSLKFPASFDDQSHRTVILSGEGYFEVASNKRQPFIVKTSMQEVEVLGTHFNISSYTNEPETKTALLEGSVQIRVLSRGGMPALESVLRPGQQASVDGSKIHIEEGVTVEAVAWKDGLFNFESTDIRAVMRQLARWYDLEVIYTDDVPKLSFSGNLHRNLDLSQALKVLEHLGLKFKLEKRTLTVYK